MEDNSLSKTFISLAEIPSPSGKEKTVSDFIENYLKKLGWKVWSGKTEKKNNSNTGNLYAYLEVNKSFETLAFSAHMDTVQKEGERVKVKFDGKVFKSDGITILGADDKAGVSALLGAAKDLDTKKLKHNILFFFPTREEAGEMGSSLFEKGSVSKIKYFFNVDGGGAPGNFVYKSLGYKNFLIRLKGEAAHAAKEYEKGKDAMKAAGLLITLLPIGKDTQKGSTFNIGEIKGGGATNVVCDLVEMKGELRGFAEGTMDILQKVILEKSKEVEEKTGVKTEVIFEKAGSAPPLVGKPDTEICVLCRKVSKKIGLSAVFEEAYFTTDANFYSFLGYEAITLSRGGSNAHTFKESLLFNDLKKATELIKELMFSQ